MSNDDKLYLIYFLAWCLTGIMIVGIILRVTEYFGG